MILHNIAHYLANLCIIGYDLDHILMLNISKLIHKFICNVKLTFYEYLDIHEGQEHMITFRDSHEINDRPFCASNHSSLKIESPFDFQVFLNGPNILSIIVFSLCKRGHPQVVSVMDITWDCIFDSICEWYGTIGILCQIKWQPTRLKHPYDYCIQRFSCSFILLLHQISSFPLLCFTCCGSMLKSYLRI